MEANFHISGIQHIGIPVRNLQETEAFYGALGFTCVHRNHDGADQVSFLQLGDLTLELYEGETAQRDGAIDHFALDCTDLPAAYAAARDAGLTILGDGMEELPFWDHGVGFFIVQGPNGERVEFCQKYEKRD